MRSQLALTALALLAAVTPGCTCEELPHAKDRPPITSPFVDNFDRTELGPDWVATDPNAVRLTNGEIVMHEGYNHPLWLERAIPRDATVEFDCWSMSPAGDIKVEIWGDGHSWSTVERHMAYTSTSYNFVFGGWNNTHSTLARMAEHGADRQLRGDVHVVIGQHYHWTITRKGGHIDWLIDGQPFMTFDDPAPLDGDDHKYFAFTDWESELHFDNLKITPR